MKVVLIHHRLAGFTSHHFNEAHGLKHQFARRGTKLELLVSVHAPAGIVAQLDARPAFDDPTFRMEWSFEERSRRFLEQLHKRVDGVVERDDCVLITVATQLEAHALTRWLTELPRRKKPWIVILMISDRWNRSGAAEYERQIAEFRKLHQAIAKLDAGDAERLIFFTLTDPLAVELRQLLGAHVEAAPIPLEYGEPSSRKHSAGHVPRVAILGGTRREKGSYLIPAIIRACRAQVPVEFLVHLTNNDLTAKEVDDLAVVARDPEVTVIPEALPLDDYNAAIESADLGLFPYESIPYRKRISGVFAEMVALGKPAVVTPGTWMAEQIEAGRAAGVVAESFEPDAIARAVAHCVQDLESLTRSAQELSAAWRRENTLSAFVDFMEARIAERSAARVT